MYGIDTISVHLINKKVFIKHDTEYENETCIIRECRKGCALCELTDKKKVIISYKNLEAFKYANKREQQEYLKWWNIKKSEIKRQMKKNNYDYAPSDTVDQILNEAKSYIDSKRGKDLEMLFEQQKTSFNSNKVEDYFQIAYDFIVI